jgi:hypothetical protein
MSTQPFFFSACTCIARRRFREPSADALKVPTLSRMTYYGDEVASSSMTGNSTTATAPNLRSAKHRQLAGRRAGTAADSSGRTHHPGSGAGTTINFGNLAIAVLQLDATPAPKRHGSCGVAAHANAGLRVGVASRHQQTRPARRYISKKESITCDEALNRRE